MNLVHKIGLSLCLILFAWASTTSRAVAQQEFVIGRFNPSDWTVANQSRDRNQIVTEFVRPNERIESWTELFTAQILRKPASPEPIDVLVPKLHQETSKLCPGMKWNVISRQAPNELEEAGMLYEWSITNCPPEADQHEVARVIYGRFTIFRLAYTAKTTALEPEKRERWIKELSAAKVVRK